MEEEYKSQSKLLLDFFKICSIDKAWIFRPEDGESSKMMFLVSQPNLIANEMRRSVVFAHISKGRNKAREFHWSPFPIDMTSASAIVPSPSGMKLLVVKNPERDLPSRFEIWTVSKLEREFCIPQTVHGSLYVDKWFEGISWDPEERFIAYVAEEPASSKPRFDSNGYKTGKGCRIEETFGEWNGQGDFEEDWGETYAEKRRPALFVIDVDSGEVRAVKGIESSISVGQVVWAPSSSGQSRHLVFVGWSHDKRKLGMKYCVNRSCALYAVRTPFHSKVDPRDDGQESLAYKLTHGISSAFFPRFSLDGKYLAFLSAKSAVDSGAHWATNSLHKLEWSTSETLGLPRTIIDVVPVIRCSKQGHFPGIYCLKVLDNPWLSDGETMIIVSSWGSREVMLAVDISSGTVSQISPADANDSWDVLAVDGNNIIAVSSSPTQIPELKWGSLAKEASETNCWSWLGIPSPIFRCSEKVEKSLSCLHYSIIQIPVKSVADCTTNGAKRDYESIFVCSKSQKGKYDPLIVILHGGPHSVSSSTFSRASAFLSALGFSLLIVNYRGSLGFGEEALQSLPGKVGSQDVGDVLAAIDHTIESGLAEPSKIAVVGLSHGGFLTTHLIGQAPERFAAAAARNPVCSFALMVGTTDIPDWCYYEALGNEGKKVFTEAPAAEHLAIFHCKSPISHASKVKTPTLFLLGAQDLRVPISTGLQYARALKEKGVEVKVMVFPDDVHEINWPRSDFESFLNIGVWFSKHCK
ncbi:hypothetical protein MLD38_010236 [Melastoma candidum]|uniref:Uncharacterized protein n=1 Tax=Melastoma candidum TaxID=119954 RepID=A0ACB9R2Q3_9MYRT|nr:hypothetical protein MLD38_010236 [Melastoma candidum]